MSRPHFPRWLTIALVAATTLVALAVFALLALAATRLPLFGRAPAVAAPIRWSGLPVPVVSRPEWTSYTYAGQINDLAETGGLLWAGTDGGLVVWDIGAGGDAPPAAKFTVEHGLPGNRVTAVVAGPDGAVWAGTRTGLGRYDGRAWRVFTTADGLPSDDIRDLVVDRDGVLWAATGGGLGAYDGREWRAVRSSGLLAQLPSDDVLTLAVGPDNRLWAGTDRGVAVSDGRDWQTYDAGDGLSEDRVLKLAVAPDGKVWAATPGGLNYFDDATWIALGPVGVPPVEGEAWAVGALAAETGGALVGLAAGAPVLATVDPTGAATPLEFVSPVPGVHAFLDGPSGRWVGTADGVYRQTPDGWARLEPPSDLPGAAINGLLEAGGELLAATSDGLVQFNGAWRVAGTDDGLAPADVRALDATSGGEVWAAFADPRDGLSRLGADGRWQSVSCAEDGPPSRQIAGLARAADGTLWLATDDGVGRFDGQAWTHFTLRDGLPAGEVTAIAVLPSGEVWAGTPAGLARFDGAGWQVVDPAAVDYLVADESGALWAVVGGRDLARLEGDTLVRLAALPGSLAVRGLAVGQGDAWLATADGVAHYDGNAWTVTTTADGLPSDDVTAVAVDAAGAVWAATSGDEQQADIVTFNGEVWTPHPARDATAEVLLSDIVRDVLTTPDGDLWLATPAGVNRYRDGRWTAYTMDDGLPGRDVRRLAWAYDALWAATDTGLGRFQEGSWSAFGTVTHGRVGDGVHDLAVAPDGRLWVSLDPGWPDGLRVFNGATWETVPTLSEGTFVREIGFLPAERGGQLVVLAEEGDTALIGLFGGQNWGWQKMDELAYQIERFAVAPDGRLWAMGQRPGEAESLTVYDVDGLRLSGVSATFSGAGDSSGAPDFLGSGNAAPILFTDDGRAVVGGAGRLFVFDAAGRGALEPLDVLDIPLAFSRHVFALAGAPDGGLWAGTERGVSALSGLEGGTWQSFYAPAQSPAWWGSIRTMSARPDGSLLLGTSGGGIGLYTGRGFDGVLHPSQGPVAWDRQFYPVNSVLLEDGVLWAASGGGGLARFDGGRWQVYAPDPALAARTESLVVSGDEAWIGTEGGLVRLAGLSSGVCRFAAVDDRLPSLAALEDRNGDIWVGTTEDGLWRLPAGTRAAEQQWTNAPVTSIAESAAGDLWFVNGHQNWLTWYRPGGANRWQRLPLNLNLVRPEAITALAVAPNRTIWLGTDHGAVVFQGGRWLHLTVADGLADNQVLDVLAGTDGTVWLATAGGLSRFRPDGSAP